ncbi:MAG: anhydro-N-acetylmuramic acid kinase [Flavobacteriaceae bacterium]
MKVFKVLGLMSGTSVDGLDMAYCHFWRDNGSWEFEVKKAKTVAYDLWSDKLKEAIQLDAEKLLIMHQEYGTYLGEQAALFIKEENIAIDFIASHGHTVHHRPDLGLTFQLGSGQHLANASEQLTVCDFRTNDVALGGQGAPLVPIGDQIFFSNYDFCLNLGGISNVSMEKNGSRIAYDIGVANMLLDHIIQKQDLAYDDKGKIARSGRLNKLLLDELNELEYYKQPFPKSTGYEWFKSEILPIIEQSKLDVPDLLHTSVHHICQQIAEQLLDHVKSEQNTLLVTGGGAFNTFLTDVLRSKLEQKIEVIIPGSELVAYKEALIFAFMGLLRTEGEINVLKSVTGATKDSCSGVIYLAS